MAMSSRFRSPADSSACLASSIALYLLSSVWFIGPSPYFGRCFFFLFVPLSAFPCRNNIDGKTCQRFHVQSLKYGPQKGHLLVVFQPSDVSRSPFIAIRVPKIP